ncbi:PqqD family protein [Deinococcus arcticus]|uniref:PqqD family protein n=1 Tax=Deinococcus arcticus TaxID=2136176 RepID=A0A2T3W5P3_9DEIO|nr:PqqD family protein [Deinococcus arcticus]PTA67192.1 PqqD family protein [Deinococcus arcticus]
MWETDPEVLVTDLGDELILMHAGRSLMYSLNATGRAAWLALPATTQGVGAALSAAFQVPAAQAEQDAHTLLVDLATQGMVRQGLEPEPRELAVGPESK